MRTRGALRLSVGYPRPSPCPPGGLQSSLGWGRAHPLRDAPGHGALGLRTPGHVGVRAPQGQTLSAWRPHPNAKRGWGQRLQLKAPPRPLPTAEVPAPLPRKGGKGFLPPPSSRATPNLGPRTSAPEPQARAPAWGPARTRSAPTSRCQVPPYAGVARIRPAGPGVPRDRTPGAPQSRGDGGPGAGVRSRAPHRRPGRKPAGPPAGGRESARSPDAGGGGEVKPRGGARG